MATAFPVYFIVGTYHDGRGTRIVGPVGTALERDAAKDAMATEMTQAVNAAGVLVDTVTPVFSGVAVGTFTVQLG